jgi:hypothetical protein
MRDTTNVSTRTTPSGQHFLGRMRPEQVLDRDIGRRDQHRLRVSQHVKRVLPVVVAHTDYSDTTKGHALDSQVDVNLIDRTATEPEFANKAIDRVLRYARGKVLSLPIELIPKRIHRWAVEQIR